MGTNADFARELRQAGSELYSEDGGGMVAGDLMMEAANRLEAAEALLGTADDMMKTSLDFTYGMGVDGELRPVKNRAMSAMRSYAEGRGIPVRLPSGEVWE